MGQVPNYGIIGGGRVSSHFQKYFQFENIPFSLWTRKQNNSIETALVRADVILLLVSDQAIETVVEENPFLENKRLVHFSGSLVTDRAVGFHPLMTFSHSLYDHETYKSIPFIIEVETSFKEIFPSLENPWYFIEKKNKALYHAACVLGGNFTTMLWSKVFEIFKGQLNIPYEAAFPYMNQIIKNVEGSPNDALTGPLVRKDLETLKKNLSALKGDSYENIYRAFTQVYLKDVSL